jgi:beta-galactosidase
MCLFSAVLAEDAPVANSPRQDILLSGPDWQYVGAGSGAALPDVDTDAFKQQGWSTVAIPHNYQTRAHFNDITQAWYRRTYAVPRELAGKRLYLSFEGAAAIADVYVNGTHLGQHRGAYTRFIFDATDALKVGNDNEIAVKVDNDPQNMQDCLPNVSRLYTVWGGLYRKVWLVATSPVHIDPTDFASPGVYITPKNVSETGADLSVEVLVRNSASAAADASVRATLLDSTGASVASMTGQASVPPAQRASVMLAGHVDQPKLWSPATPNLYHVRVELLQNGQVVDAVTEPTGFRSLVWQNGQITVNGKPMLLFGADLHQEIESKGSAMSDDDFRHNFDLMKDMGANVVRLSHYPRARIEYDLCDKLGLFCWTENGHTNKNEPPSPTAEQITTEMVKQNYNHPSIAIWSVGNEASPDTAEAMLPVVRALDPTRPVGVANMACKGADVHGINDYPGWYGKDQDFWNLKTEGGCITETGAGGVVTTHTDYAAPPHTTDKYEPEEYQQLVAEAHFETVIKENVGAVSFFTWWTMRDFEDIKYKKPLGWNTKGLLTYAGDKKDVYYLYRCFLRPDEPTIHITSKRYFLRTGAVDNGVKVYSTAPQVTLTLNGEKVSTLDKGKYTQANMRTVDNVFYWPVPLHTGKNVVQADDGARHTDSATIYFYGQNGLPPVPDDNPLVKDVQSSNTANTAYYMDMPAQAQWPIYYDLDSTADNSFDELPPQVDGATWIATRRVTKSGQEAELTFTVTRPATVYVMATKEDRDPSYLTSAGFEEVPVDGLRWRGNDLTLVPAQLFSHKASAGDTIHLGKPDRDQIVLIKEGSP